MGRQQKESEHWLARYANNYHAWKAIGNGAGRSFIRPMGLVETSFDIDGRHYGGRADMNALLTLEVKHTLPSKEAFRDRVALAWVCLQVQHVMLMSRVHADEEMAQRSFVVEVPTNKEEALRKAKESIVWVEDAYDEVDEVEFHRHAMNVGRILEPEVCLAKLFVLPLVELPGGNRQLRFLIVMAHQISDGLTSYNWFSHLVRLFNMSATDLGCEIEAGLREESIRSRLPPAQEDLYPKVAKNKARERWFWAIIRVLRSIRKTLPPTFVNPLRRDKRLAETVSFPSVFSKIFDYSEARKPPLNAGHVSAALSVAASQRLVSLCRSINVSVGAGCFALAGLSMMEMHERKHPDIAFPDHHAFAASFPLNPRAFFGFTTAADSCMLSFSDGIVMPFLPRSLPVEGRFKVIARRANRELKMYQKRDRGKLLGSGLEASVFDPHSPGRLLANSYLFQLERVQSKLPPQFRTNVNPQGDIPVRVGAYAATCGVSSVGSSAAFFTEGAYDLDIEAAGKDFAADFRALKTGVRARDNEFLVGIGSDAQGIVGFGVSYDASAISEEAAAEWAETTRMLLEPGEKAKL